MKKVILLLLFFFPLYLCAQHSSEEVVPDDRLFDAFEADYIQRLTKENPFLVKRWNFYLDHAFIIKDRVAEKGDDYPEVVIDDLEKINILKLEKEQGLKRDWNKPMIYLVRDSGKMLIYHSGKSFHEALKKQLAK